MGFLFKIVQRILVPLLFLALIRSLLRDYLLHMRSWENQRNGGESNNEKQTGHTEGPGAHYRTDWSASPYSVLGLPRNASDDEVRSRYHELIAKYHPDKFASLHDPEFTRLAAEKFQRVQHAYDEIKRQRGL